MRHFLYQNRYRMLIATSVIGFASWGINSKLLQRLDRHFNAPEIPESGYFQENSTEDILSKKLQTGDLILFKRKLSVFRPLQSIMALASRRKLQGDFDHMGIIVLDKEKESPYVLEFDTNKIKYQTFEDKVNHSMDKDIVVRLLRNAKLDHSKLNQLRNFIQAEVLENGKSRDDYPTTLKRFRSWNDSIATIFHSTPESVDPHFSLYHAYCIKKCQNRLKSMHRRAFLQSKETKELMDASENARTQIEQHEKEIERLSKLKNENPSALRCSSAAFAAEIYILLGLLPELPPAECYNVDSFAGIKCKKYSQLRSACLPLVGDAVLEDVLFFRAKN